MSQDTASAALQAFGPPATGAGGAAGGYGVSASLLQGLQVDQLA